jgi:hypothetical protein
MRHFSNRHCFQREVFLNKMNDSIDGMKKLSLKDIYL